MDAVEKLEVLTGAAQYDICQGCGTQAQRVRGRLDRWIYPAALPDGRRVKLLKILLSNACDNNCSYCANRRGRDFPRTEFTPEELSWLFVQMRNAGLVEGLFLSSGVSGSPARVMERMIAAVELVRFKYEFTGYIHLKILPGADAGSIERAVELADRASLNLEAPSEKYLARIAGDKDFHEGLLGPLKLAKSYADEKGSLPAGMTTQFVVGAAGESDWEILCSADRLYRELKLARVYYSAFQPVSRTPLEGHPPTPLVREHRLYQADWLLRKYGFGLKELAFDAGGNLPTDLDPKLAWARRHPDFFPVEVNRADREELLRVPGIGLRSVWRILKQRREAKFRTLKELKQTGCVIRQVAPFILLDGRQPPVQLRLWERPRWDLRSERLEKPSWPVAGRWLFEAGCPGGSRARHAIVSLSGGKQSEVLGTRAWDF